VTRQSSSHHFDTRHAMNGRSPDPRRWRPRRLGEIITRYEATLTCFMADGLMLLLNAPLPCPEPALRGVHMALDMRAAVQGLITGWRARGYTIGFGIGLAQGPATVGRIGYEGRIDYTAIGSIANLASRICASAEDGQILIDPTAAAEVSDAIMLEPLGKRPLGVDAVTLRRALNGSDDLGGSPVRANRPASLTGRKTGLAVVYIPIPSKEDT
jgi:class 3 adenylate cyclase